MIFILEIYKYCQKCMSTGKYILTDESNPANDEEIDCPDCNGTGKIKWGIMEEVEV